MFFVSQTFSFFRKFDERIFEIYNLCIIYHTLPMTSATAEQGGAAAGATEAMSPRKFWLVVHNAFGPTNNSPVHSLVLVL